MSTDPGGKVGGKAVADELMADAKAIYDAALVEEEQLALLDPLTAEEMAIAHQECGPNAGNLAVLAHAREKRKGRPKHSKNRRSDDFAAYISQFGPDPAVVLAQIAGDTEEAMVERSRQLDPIKRRLSWGDARAYRIRCAEALMPYRHGKKPVTVDANIRGVMVVEEISDGSRMRSATIDGEIIGVGLIDQDGDL